MVSLDTELTFQQRNVVATLKDHATFIDGAIDTIEQKAHHNFTVINIIIAVAGAVNLCSLTSPAIPRAIQQNVFYALTFLPTVYLVYAYLRTAFLSVDAMTVEERGSHPILVTPEEVKRWEGYCVADYYKWTVDAYIDIYRENHSISRSKAKSVVSSHKYIRNAIVAMIAQTVFCGIALYILQLS